ncbi:MAG TPA: LLM class flavin-dependent oxidoreductase [Acidimicrobiales bacterium]|nr:LLM class flavin-dependent oxidoreductase [Acidimicrobiales bacterium]
MSLGLVLPTFPQTGPLPSARELAALASGAEEAGASALWACDHLYWHGPVLECFSALAVVAAATAETVVGTCVLQLPLRRPEAVAKQAGSLDHLSGGRFVLGVGSGSRPGEYAAAGVSFESRGRALDEGIDRVRRAWASVDAYRQLPAPRDVPVWVGGSSEAAVRRAAWRGDGWIPLFLSPGEFADASARMAKEAVRAGRDPASIRRAVVLFASIDGEDPAERGLRWMGSLYGMPGRAFARHLVAGSARDCARVVERYVEAGAEHVAVFVTADAPLVPFAALAQEFAGRTDAPPGPPLALADAQSDR